MIFRMIKRTENSAYDSESYFADSELSEKNKMSNTEISNHFK
jgi:hypothetical protein